MTILSKKDWLLVPLFIVGLFAFGYQAIPLFNLLYLPITLAYTRHGYLYRILAYIVISSLSYYLCFIGSFHEVESSSLLGSSFFILVASIGVQTLLSTTLLVDRYVLEHSTCIWQRVLVFPTAWTSLWYLICEVGLFGDYIIFNLPLMNWPDLYQISSMGGIYLVTLLVSLFATVLLELPNLPIKNITRTPTFQSTTIYNSIENIEVEDGSNIKHLTVFLKHPFTIIMAVMAAVFTYGGAHNNIPSGSFYQVGYPSYIPKVEPVGCIAGPGSTYPELQLNTDHWLQKTEELAQNGLKLITWSELTTMVPNLQMEEVLLKRAQAIALKYSVYLNIAYGVIDPVGQNKLVFIDKYGKIGINYNKAHPVPGVETQPAGENKLQYMDTEDFGRVSAAICFDFNFRSLIKQASKHDVDVMLQSSWTWGPIGTYLGQTNQIRAVENGYTLLRCASQGLSGVFEPKLGGIFNQKVGSLNDEAYVFNLPVQKRFNTVYGYLGDVIVLISSAYCLITVCSIFYYKSRRHQQ
ncbi:carbon-nitrogen hydrolase [Pilobolus umbonatus]|nr:carbon-nitrogen hydrolase [Pilobolus umbonatus]